MDEYSVKTVRLLMQRHKDYLVSILRRHSDNVPSISELTEADAIRVLSSVNDCSMIPHANNKTVSSFYACKCGSKHITVREVQNRSSDEASTILLICQDCSNRWILK